MNATVIEEPELEFGAGRHIDIRFGIKDYGPLDALKADGPRQIRLGVIGTPATIEGLRAWFDKCGKGIPSKDTNKPNLFPRFPGFGPESSFKAGFIFEERLNRAVPEREFEKVSRAADMKRVITEAVGLFQGEIKYIKENGQVDVVICALPMSLVDAMEAPAPPEEDEHTEGEAEAHEPEKAPPDFHHLLKARAMRLGKPIQLVLPTTYDERIARRQKRKPHRARRLQDEATRAWNLHVALYYKAGGTPWRMSRTATDLATCFVGISFFKALSGEKIHTSVAQVFNERGEGMVVRGGPAQVSKEDRQPHLASKDAFDLLKRALEKYRAEHRTFPARVVVHKSSFHTPEELEGFQKAIKQKGIDGFDCLNVGRSFTRLFRLGVYPPLRGTFMSCDEKNHILYTRGSVDFFRTYPGMYVPRPLRLRLERCDQTPTFLAQEILALTKMNWNNTQFDNGEPITLRASRQVGQILKYLRRDDPVEPRYSYYM